MKLHTKSLSLALLVIAFMPNSFSMLGMDDGQGQLDYMVLASDDYDIEAGQPLTRCSAWRSSASRAKECAKKYADAAIALAITAGESSLAIEGDATRLILAHIGAETINGHTEDKIRDWKSFVKIFIPTVGATVGFSALDSFVLLPYFGFPTKIGAAFFITSVYQLIHFFKDHSAEREKFVNQILALDDEQKDRVLAALSAARHSDEADASMRAEVAMLQARIKQLEEIRLSAVLVDDGSGVGHSSDTSVQGSPGAFDPANVAILTTVADVRPAGALSPASLKDDGLLFGDDE